MRTPGDLKLHFLRSFIAVTSVAFCALFAHDCYFPSDREWGPYIGAITLCSIFFLLVFSSLCFPRYRRTAFIGFAIAIVTLILGGLSPEL
jgi:hypothetical protein